MFRRLAFAIFTAAILVAQAPRYTIHDLGPLNNGAVTGINIHGQVTGYDTQSNGRVRSFRTAPNAAINWSSDDLGSLGGTTTRARGINTSGQVVGESTLSTGELRGFRTLANKPIQAATDNIGTLTDGDTRAVAINDIGQVTGASGGHPFLTAPNSPIDPPRDQIDVAPNQLGSSGRYVNNRGHMLGEFMSQIVNYPTAFVYTGRTVAITDVRRAPMIGFVGFTELDQIVFNPSAGTGLMLWQDGKEVRLANCSMPCVPANVNNFLQVVGAGRLSPFLYSDGVMYDLSNLIPQGSGWTLSIAGAAFSGWAINDLGQIAGSGMINNETHAVRLDPVASVPSAIAQTMSVLLSFHLSQVRRNTASLLVENSLASRLQSALASWNAGNPAATRGYLNEFESLVRAQTGQALTKQQSQELIDLAEAAIALT